MSIPALMDAIPDEAAAYLYLENLRWGDTPVCPHCGSVASHYFLKPRGDDGRKTRTGKVTHRRLWKCKDCRKQFSVLTGTIFHGSKIAIRTWLFVIFEMCASKNGVSSREIERKYKLTPKAAWFLLHRIREGMKRDGDSPMFTGTVLADETYIGPNPKNMPRKVRAGRDFYARDHKTPVVSVVHPETGEVRSQVVPNVHVPTLRGVLERHVDLPNTTLVTDSAPVYTKIGWKAADHQVVNHKMSQYVTRTGASTNQAEGYFSQLKRSIDGTFHHVSVDHLDRYLAEFDYRYSTRKMSDTQRVQRLMGQVPGRRLQYRPLIGD
jgi:transposase-like protein